MAMVASQGRKNLMQFVSGREIHNSVRYAMGRLIIGNAANWDPQHRRDPVIPFNPIEIRDKALIFFPVLGGRHLRVHRSRMAGEAPVFLQAIQAGQFFWSSGSPDAPSFP